MTKDKKVRVKKTALADNPSFESFSSIEEYEEEKWLSFKSVPVDYEVEGVLLADIEEDGFIYMARTKKNGKPACGIFRSSRIQKMQNNFVETYNSKYIIEEIK